MATTTYTIKGMQLSDSTAFDVSALSNMSLKRIALMNGDTGSVEATGGNNMIIGSNALTGDYTGAYTEYPIKNVDVRSYKSVRIWPGVDGDEPAEIDLMGDGVYYASNGTIGPSNINQVHVKAIISKELAGTDKNKTIRLKQSCSELELNNKNCTGDEDEDIDSAGDFSIKAKYGNSFQGLNIKGNAIDIRATTNGVKGGTGGGIAVQIASCDSSFKENKFKIETARKVDVFNGLPSSKSDVVNFYNTTDDKTFEGGSGIEIGTINSQFESFGTAEMRRLADTSVFAVTRGTIEQNSDSKKWDYPTQSDDSKDIKSLAQGTVTWRDIINAALYLKVNGSIPTDGFYAVNVVLNLGEGVTSTNTAAYVKKYPTTDSYSTTIEGTKGIITLKVNGVDVTSSYVTQDTGAISIPSENITGEIEITVPTAA